MLVEIVLTLQLTTGGGAPNIIIQQPYDTLEECEDEERRFRRSSPPSSVWMRARDGELHEVQVTGLTAACGGALTRRQDASLPRAP